MSIVVKEIFTKKDKKKFFKFFIDLYKNNPYASPNFYDDEFGEFDPEINDAFRFCECKMFLAYRGKAIVGRVAAIWHKGSNEKSGLKQMRFTRLDMIDDIEVTKALLNAVVSWAKEAGMTEVIGPISFSDLNEEGMLIKGFDRPAMYIEIYNHPYYVTHMEQLGAYKVVDWYGFRIPVPAEVDERLTRMSLLLQKRYNLELVDVKSLSKKARHNFILDALDIMDEEYKHLYGTTPLSDKQKERSVKTIEQAIIPEFACLILKDKKLIAFGYVIPSLTRVMQKAKGSIIPFGIIPLIKAITHPKIADMMAIGICKEYQNLGLTAIIMDSVLRGLQKLGVQYLETGPELETNHNVQNLWKNYNPERHKQRRCWGIDVDKFLGS